MLYTPLKVAGAYEISVEKFEDDRGFFARVFNHPEAVQYGFLPQIVQVNNSYNRYKGTLRGLHYQVPPHQESKIVRAVQGALWDVILDLRQDSPTFGQWDCVTLVTRCRRSRAVVTRPQAGASPPPPDDPRGASKARPSFACMKKSALA